MGSAGDLSSDPVGGRDRASVIRVLAGAGCVAADEEADELIRASRGGAALEERLRRRLLGEPLAWIVGSVRFCGIRIRVDPGVYVPRPQTEPLARRAASMLPADGVAVDLCTGSGAVATILRLARPGAEVVGTDIDPAAVACAIGNGVAALTGDLDDPLPRALRGRVDVMTAVVPYVPTDELHLLPRDVVAHEPRRALDGGSSGARMLERAAAAGSRWLRPGGTLLLELGGDQAAPLARTMSGVGLQDIRVYRDGDGRVRAITAHRPGQRETSAPPHAGVRTGPRVWTVGASGTLPASSPSRKERT